MLNGTAPAVLPAQCYADGAAAPNLKLTNGQASIPGTKYGKYDLVGMPLKGRFVAGEPEYTAYAFTCIGDGNYTFVEMVVIDADGQRLATTPATTEEAVKPVAEEFEPGKSISAAGPYSFDATTGSPTLSGTWSAHNGGTFKAKIVLAQASATTPITQVATSPTGPAASPAAAKATRFFATKPSEDAPQVVVGVSVDGNQLSGWGASVGANWGFCFKGAVTDNVLTGKLYEGTGGPIELSPFAWQTTGSGADVTLTEIDSPLSTGRQALSPFTAQQADAAFAKFGGMDARKADAQFKYCRKAIGK